MRQVDPHVRDSMKAGTNAYRVALRAFLTFLAFYNVEPVGGPSFDDLLVEWKNDNVWPGGSPPKQTFANAIAAIEKVHPRYKGERLASREALGA